MKKIINIEKHLRGLTVLKTDTGNRLGVVADAIVHPVEGTVMGIIVRTDQRYEHALTAQDFFIGKDAVMANADARFIEEDANNQLKGGVPALGEIVGTNIVTKDGKLLGRVSEVYISSDMSQSVYRVTESTLQKFWGGGFYISGDLPSAYSHDGVRLIVPADTEARHAVKAVTEAFGDVRQDADQEATRRRLDHIVSAR